ncbi:hypothetical protein CW750_08525 [Latilactobacillus sakei]|uniref:hypothetical protein n=1 Tax=Latilactobacillus sakei TaxID=1599 RepID=UPI000DCAA2AC|nr:hypothetical protein [Latilactobacillus sakei]AWZ43146.1 hypothetical protein CW750_08525 [Latilactobacillus sakei]
MSTINGKVCVVDGIPVDKVFSDGRQVYGRNLISGSYDSSWSFAGHGGATIQKVTMDSGEVALHVISNDYGGFWEHTDLPSGTYTISFEVKGTGALKKLGWDGMSDAGMALTSDWQRVSRTGSIDSNMWYAFVFYGTMDAYVRLLKIEQGSVATPWTPAPEDVLKGAITAPNNLV